MTRVCAALVLVVAVATPAGADAPPVTCHCFRTRTFDPARPGSADPYILATTRSSLLSAAFGVEKGTLVRAVMSGTSPDDLWIAYLAAARTGRTAASLLDEREARGSWKAALEGGPSLPRALTAALARAAPDADLAAVAVDEVLLARLGTDPDSLAALHAAGARSDEAVLAAFLAPRLGTLPPQLLARIRTGRATWGIALRDAGLAPDRIDGAIRAAVAARTPAR